MVMSLPQPSICSLQIVDDIVAERQNGVNAVFFNGISQHWRAKVEEYINQSGSPEFVHRWPAIDGHKGSFLNLYSSPSVGSVQGEMLSILRDHDLTICPACGEPGRPITLDHYLPKGKYPHFCVTPLNLFPMCDSCQGEKLEKTGNANTPRFFIHPYFDVFVAQQVIRLAIMPPYNTPTFALLPCPSLTISQSALVVSHVRELGIERRFGHYFRGQYRRLLRLVSELRASGQNIEINLTAFKNMHAEPSVNSWEHVFFSAVLADAELLEFLTNSPLPAYP
jgi:hypothetical protein